MKFHYRKHKMRFDRGRTWYSIFNSIITAILVTVFTSDTTFLNKILIAFFTFVFIYIIGYIDDRLKLIDREQKQFGDRNPKLNEILKEIKEIKSKLK